MPYAKNPDDGARIYYEVTGDGPPLLLVHGLTMSRSIWSYTGYLDALRDRYRLILIDLRGHGKSECPDFTHRYGYRISCSDVIAVLDELPIERAAYFGYSQGARIGYRLAAWHPARFNAMILTSGGYSAEPPDMLLDPDAWFRQGPETVIAICSEFFDNLDNGLKQELAENDGRGWDRTAAGIADEPSVKQLLPSIPFPCLIFAEDTDQERFAENRRAAKLIPGAEFIALPDLNHFQAIERSDLILPHITSFLDRKLEEKPLNCECFT